MTVTPDPTANDERSEGIDAAATHRDANGEAERYPEEGSGVASETVTELLAALLARVPESVLPELEADSSLTADTRAALTQILTAERPAHEAAVDIGDLLRAQGAPRAANEFYRAAFYLGDEWEQAARNPLFARFTANKASRPFDKWVHYFDIYQRTLAPFVGAAPRVLEIGVFHGGGLDQLRFLLGADAYLVGVDIDEAARAACRGRFTVEIGDQTDPEFLQRVVDEHGPFDIIIDDGGHTMSQQIGSLELLFPALSPGGRYLVEDTHTSYWAEYQDSDVTFIEWIKDRLDDLNAYHHSRERQLPIWATHVLGIHVYDSVVVLDKGQHYPPFAEVAGSGSALLDSRRSDLELLHHQSAVNVRTAQLDETREQASAAVADALRRLQDADDFFRDLQRRHAEELEAQQEAEQQTLAELERSREDLERSKEDLKRTHHALRELRTSKSWRWTSPLRRSMRGLGR